MKTNNQMKPLAKFIAASLAVGSMAGFGAQALAQTAAGTLIKNLATVTYEDENGNSYSAQSNEAVVTVAPVYFATIESDNALTGAPGQTVYFPHVLTNTGNIEDIYTIATGTGADVYLDTNGNGQPDPGEVVVTSATVPAGGQVNLVVAVPVPTNAVDGTTIDTKLTVTSGNANGVVDDIGANGDVATDPVGTPAVPGTPVATNDDTVTVSTGAVLVANKSSVIDEATNTITYTLTVRNNGSSDATNVVIYDAIPKVDTDGDGVTDQQMSFVNGSEGVNGIGDATGNSTITGFMLDESGAVGDVNADGVIESLIALQAADATLPPNTTVSMFYSATYDPAWPAGAAMENTFKVIPDDATLTVQSNTTYDEIPQTYAVVADDETPPDADDEYEVASAATGADVEFLHTIINNGNGDDIFNIDVQSNATDGFPPLTVFTYWDATGTVQLTDSDGDGVPDTGVLGASDEIEIMVKANLPADYSDETDGKGPTISGGDGTFYEATLTATSSADPSSTPVSDPTALILESITAASVDIANGTLDAGLPVLATPGFNDLGADNAHPLVPELDQPGIVGGAVVFDLILANESGSSDSFLLGTGALPMGWSVVFKDAAGNVITTTPLVSGEGTFAYTAEVTISDEATEALTDTDYLIPFTATSATSPTITDTVTDSVDVAPDREVAITPNGQNQVQPGGTVEYSHVIENNGNQEETLVLDVANTQTGWTTIVKVDTTGDGVMDSIYTPGVTTSIWGIDEGGAPFEIIPTTDAVTGDTVITIPPGVDIPMTTTVAAPSNAPLGATDVSTLTLTDTTGTLSPVKAEDQTTVMLGQVRLDKKAAIDSDCEGPIVPSIFLANQTEEVAPEGCVVWQLTAVNEGTATVNNVKISDAAPEFTDYVLDSLKFCKNSVCNAATTDLVDGDEGSYSNDLISFTSATLEAGETMTGEFTVKVQ